MCGDQSSWTYDLLAEERTNGFGDSLSYNEDQAENEDKDSNHRIRIDHVLLV